MQKFIGSKFFDWDLQMYNEKTDEPAKARSSDVNEELGQVIGYSCNNIHRHISLSNLTVVL